MMQGIRGIQGIRGLAQHQSSWVRRFEHGVLRLVSLAFSLASAHAIRWFFAPLDGVDVFQPAITWTIAIGFGVLGYFVSRGLAHRLMHKERIRAYAPICLIVEFVEIFCNYALAAAVIQHATWLTTIPANQRAILTALTYVVLAIIPLVSLLLAVVDMDLERHKKAGGMGAGLGNGVPNGKGPLARPPLQAQPKMGGFTSGGNPAMNLAPTPAYTQGYVGVAPAPQASKQGGAGNAVPFGAVPSLQTRVMQ